MKTDVLIIGAGFAGAATAYHLSRAFRGSVVVVDKEDIPGYHASGRNASLVLQSVENAEIRGMVARSRDAFFELRDQVGFRECGSVLLGRRSQLERVRDPGTVQSSYLDPLDLKERIPPLRGHDFEAALLTPGDGVIDISCLLQFYLKSETQARVTLELNTEVVGIAGTGPFQVQTSRGPIEAGRIVNAAGAWAPAIARLAGVEPLPMRSFKRHLFILDGFDFLEPDWPFVWSVERNFYFRPESGGLLFSVCDEQPSDGPFEPTVNPEIVTDLVNLIFGELPGFNASVQRRVWSCFRTKTPGGLFHLGRSQQCASFFWVAGLGGHGVGCSWEVGRLAAELLQS